MSADDADTIVALATPQGRGGLGVIRVSGSKAKTICKQMVGKDLHPRQVSYSKFYDQNNRLIDEGIAVYFQQPHSYTGDDVLELHGHGGPYVLDALIEAILHYGARMARPGEFTERAFLNDKMDLVQAEAVADLIDAGSREAARCAVRSLRGDFSEHVHDLVEALIELRIYVEAAIDFPEEEIDFLADERIGAQLDELLRHLKETLRSAHQGAILREGIQAVIVGRPNAGKSSLLNALSGQESAIVTHIEGTTRDVLKEHIQIDGIPVHIIDTAGIRQSNDEVEKIGIERAKAEVAKADLVLLVVDPQQINTTTLDDVWPVEINKPEVPIVVIENKIDLTNKTPQRREIENGYQVCLSAKYGSGIDDLKYVIKKIIGFQEAQEGQFIARRRHLDALNTAQSHIEKAQQQFAYKAGELIAEELRLAQQQLNQITGEFTSDDLLGRIFSSFCIGK